jgi:hypothetical protein
MGEQKWRLGEEEAKPREGQAGWLQSKECRLQDLGFQSPPRRLAALTEEAGWS